ncbi:hypothetical protein VTN77DRAFT_2626 [Rasamsonia byssochlamydoides]|uniref:uncharacterized protein n=1 Tax=Rasamsonia byssochlamydoides TaxID=89139 RepID=UPI0037435452
MDNANLWTRRSNSSKLSLSTSGTDKEGGAKLDLPRSHSSKRFGPDSSHGRSNPFNALSPLSAGVSSPSSSASNAFGLGSGAFASFGSPAKTPKSSGSTSDLGSSSKGSGDNKRDSPSEQESSTADNVKSKASSSSLNNAAPAPALKEHPLKSTWVVWYRPPTPKYSDYEKSTVPLASISSVESFWTIYSHLKRPSLLPTVSDYHIFKKGIRPVWEDEANKKGGKWIVRLKKGVADRYWEDLLLAMVGDQFAEAGDEVCGAVLSVRSGEDVLSVWTRIDGGRNIKIRETIKRLLAFPADTNIVWKSHDDSIAQRSAIDQARQEKAAGNQGHHHHHHHHVFPTMPKSPNLTAPRNLMLDKRRHVDTPSDERRLFPSFDRKHRDEVPIIPGGTFRKAGKTSVQSLAMLKPVDTLSRNSRESGPVRAQGKSKQPVNDQTSPAPRSPQVNYPAEVDDFERPAKRQRRDISSPVIDLVDDEEVQVRRNSSPVLSPEAPRGYRLSSTSSQGSARARKPPESGNEVGEYRGVEKLMAIPRKNSSKHSLQKKQDLFAGDGRAESSAQNIKQRRLRSLSSDLDQPTNRTVLESVEIYNPTNGIGARSSRESPSLQRQFVPADGKRRTSDMRESPDELQGEATVQPAPSSLSVPSKRDRTSESRSADRSEKDARKGMSPSDIQPTVFASSRQSQEKKHRKHRKSTNGKSHVRLFEASFFRFGSVLRVASEKETFEFVFDNSNETIGLAAVNETEAAENTTVPVRKVALALQGGDGSRKVRLKFSKTEGSCDEEMDIELQSEKDKVDLCSLLETKGVTVRKKESDWMDKAFVESLRKAKRREINPCKRPSTETTPDSVSEVKVEHVKRRKLSASLQGDDGVVASQPAGAQKQPPRRLTDSSTRDQPSPAADTHSHPVAKEDDSCTPIPVKKSSSPSEGRETRSKARRGPVSLISDEGPPSPKKSNDALPKWSRPLVYPREGKKKAEVDHHDIERLRDGEFLNDNLIGFYLRFLEHHLERTNPEASKRIYFFNSYFFATLTNTPRGKRGINYEGVQKWTRNVDLFSHDYVIVPINESAHWYLAIICNLSSLQRREESASAEPAPRHRDVPKEEIPETPPGDEPDKAEVVEPEETTRQSFASMTLSDTAPDVSKEHAHESDDEWPEKEENPTSSPPKFSTAGDGSRSAEREEVEQAAEQKATKQKRKGRKHDTHQPVIITFDSLGATRNPAIKSLRAYLLEEAMSKRSLQIDPKEIRGMAADEIPLQPNFSDCGLYLLAYLEKFAQDPDLFVEKLLRREMSADRDWPPLISGLLRRRLRDFLYKLQEEQENIQRNKVSGEKTLVDKKPISFLLGSAHVSTEQEDRSVSKSPEELEKELEEELSKGIQSEADAIESVETRSTSHRLDERSQSRSGDIDTRQAERQKSGSSSVEEQPDDRPEVVEVDPEVVEPATDQRTETTARPKTPETGSRSKVEDPPPRSSPRLARKATSPTSPKHERHHHQSTENWVDELWDLTGSPKRVTVEVQVPGTPPSSSSKSGVVRDSPRGSPKQVKQRSKSEK